MARTKAIRVMISSRCTDKIEFGGKPVSLSEVRLEIKSKLEKERLLGAELLEVWINEDAPPEEGTTDSWDTCLKQVDEADIVIVLYNGNAGWAASDKNIGICHAELERAISKAPAKVRLIELEPKVKESSERNKRFQEYVQHLSLFRGAIAKTGEQVIQRVEEAIREAISDLAHLGLREAKKGKYHLGEALDWTRLDFAQRKEAIEQTVCDALGSDAQNRMVTRQVAGVRILFRAHAVPDAFSTTEAREMVGRPFLKDYALVETAELKPRDTYGPVHLIAVHKTVGETQARNLMGHPDIILVKAPFGYYLADRIQHVQVLLVAGCRDATSTRHAVQRCFDWIEQSGEWRSIVDRAKRRKKVIELIAQQIE
jgi:hypothetical protein